MRGRAPCSTFRRGPRSGLRTRPSKPQSSSPPTAAAALRRSSKRSLSRPRQGRFVRRRDSPTWRSSGRSPGRTDSRFGHPRTSREPPPRRPKIPWASAVDFLPSTATRLLIRQRFRGVASSLLPESRRPGNGRDSRWVEIASCTGSVIMIANIIYMDNHGYLYEVRQSPGRTARASEDLSKLETVSREGLRSEATRQDRASQEALPCGTRLVPFV